jgi:hypothetical protein
MDNPQNRKPPDPGNPEIEKAVAEEQEGKYGGRDRWFITICFFVLVCFMV